MSLITIFRSTDPPFTGKQYFLGPDGLLRKKTVASIRQAVGWSVEVSTLDKMLKVLSMTTEQPDHALVLSAFNNDDGCNFGLVPEAELRRLLGTEVGTEGVHTISGRRVAARLKRGMRPSSWILLDADDPPGIRDEWRSLSLGERLERLDAVLPGVATVSRVEYRGSSARVVKSSSHDSPGATHALIQVSDPTKIDVLREYLKIETVNAGLSFRSPRRSRAEPDKIIGHEHRTLIDLSVLISGRVVFNARPDVTNAPGYSVLEAQISLIASGGPDVLDIDWLELPAAHQLEAYRAATGKVVAFSVNGGGLTSNVDGELAWDTEIEHRGQMKLLRDWVADLKPGDKLRCETPFRASQSEAAFISLHDDGAVALHDVGTSTTYWLRNSSRGDGKAGSDSTRSGSSAQWRPIDRRVFNSGDVPAPELGPEKIPATWRKWIWDTAIAHNAPRDYVALNLFVAAAGAIGNARCAVATATWSQPSVLWGMAIGAPSIRKTTAQSPIIEALSAIDQDSYRKWLAACEIEQAEHDIALAAAKKAKTAEPRLVLPPLPRLSVGDTTLEALTERMAQNPHGVIAQYGEMAAWFGSFDRYNSGHGGDRATWLTFYDAGRHVVDRVKYDGKPLVVERAACSLLGAITTDALRAVLEKSANDGLLSRFLLVWPDPPPIVPLANGGEQEAAARRDRLRRAFAALHGLELEIDYKQGGVPRGIRLTKEACEAFDCARMATERRARAARGAFAEWLGKNGGRLLRLALVFEYLEWSAEPTAPEPQTIGLDAVEQAVAYLDYVSKMFRRVLAGLEPTTADDDTRDVVALLMRRGLTPFTNSDIGREPGFRWFRGETKETAPRRDNVLTRLEEAGAIRPEATGSRRGQIRKWAVNPQLLKIVL